MMLLFLSILLAVIIVVLLLITLKLKQSHVQLKSKHKQLYKDKVVLTKEKERLKYCVIHNLGKFHKLANLITQHSHSCANETFYKKCRQYFLVNEKEKFVLRDAYIIVNSLNDNKLEEITREKNFSEKDLMLLSLKCLHFSNKVIIELFEFKNRLYIYNRASNIKERLKLSCDEQTLDTYLKRYFRGLNT